MIGGASVGVRCDGRVATAPWLPSAQACCQSIHMGSSHLDCPYNRVALAEEPGLDSGETICNKRESKLYYWNKSII